MADVNDVTKASDGAAGGGGSPTATVDADVVTVRKADWELLQSRIAKAEEVTKEVIDSRKKAKLKADEEAQKALDAENAKKTVEQKLADIQAEWDKKWAEKEAAEKAEKDKLQAELKQQKLINSIAQLQGLRPEAKPFDILTLIQSELKFNESGELDSESLIAAIQSRPFLMADKEVKPKIPMTAGKPKEKEPGIPNDDDLKALSIEYSLKHQKRVGIPTK